MSIPQPKILNGVPAQTYSVIGGVTSTNPYFVNGVVKVRSVVPARRQVPYKYRLKVWVYKGKVFTKLKRYRPKTIRYSPDVWRPPLPYSGSFSEGDVTHFQGRVEYKDIWGGLSGRSGCLDGSTYGLVSPAIPSFTGSLENRAVIKALNKLKNQNINLGVAFTERHETSELLLGTLRSLSTAASALRRGDLRRVGRALDIRPPSQVPRGKVFFEKFLELQYGWRPLLSDLYGAVAALHERDQADAQRYAVTVKAAVKDPFRVYTNGRQGPDYTTVSSVYEGFEGAFVRLDYFLENPLLASLSSLGITNPLEIVWERVPYSFLVDWFLPIGAYLSALDATLGYQFRAGSVTRLFRSEYHGNLMPGKRDQYHYPYRVYGSANVRQLAISREVYGSSPLPRIPSFKNPLPKSGQHIANAIALLSSRLRH